MKLEIPEVSLVVLVGVSGSGKSTFARRHFLPTEVVSSDVCRGLVADDQNDQAATGDAFDVLQFIAAKRLQRNRLTVVDATSVQSESRRKLIQLARDNDCLAVAIVLDVKPKLAIERNTERPDRTFGARVVTQQHAQLRQGLRGLKREGFSRVHVLSSPEEIDAAQIERRPLWNDRRSDKGPFDIIGDVHGCREELHRLLETLGYRVSGSREDPQVVPPEGRRALFVGDLVDRGPDSPGVLRLVMRMVESGAALCIPGNHEIKLLKYLRGKKVRLTHGLERTVEQLESEPEGFAADAARFIDGLVSHFVLDDGRLVAAHAGLREAYQGRASARVRSFCLYGETTGETDEFGLPVRYDWAQQYRGRAAVVYGHTPVPTAEWVNNTICIDTGCVFGGRLTALRYPERELVDVSAAETYYEPIRPFEEPAAPSTRPDDILDIKDVTGRRIVDTRVRHTVTIREENAIAALEVMSRFAVDPRWLLYLPPTMSPTQTAPEGSDLLERPQEAFDYFARNKVDRVVCEEKHMGSRAVLVVARSVEAAERRFGASGGRQGVVYTRTGRAFFGDPEVEQALVRRVAAAIEADGAWTRWGSDWVCLDAELMPWSLKAVELLRTQYAAVGAAASASLGVVNEALAAGVARGLPLESLQARFTERATMVAGYGEAWRQYCWQADGLDGVRLAPFHLLATEGTTYFDKTHAWHMDELGRLQAHDSLLMATRYRTVNVGDPADREAAVEWWTALTDAGGEGMVLKPEAWLARGPWGLVQPALKVRGREYLRIIYGPEYTAPENLERLRQRGLSTKRSLALREFALGVEALHRVAEGAPLWRVHEAVFGVLALESEPVDPRL